MEILQFDFTIDDRQIKFVIDHNFQKWIGSHQQTDLLFIQNISLFLIG